MTRYCSVQLYAERAAHALEGKWSILPIMSVWNQMSVPVSLLAWSIVIEFSPGNNDDSVG